MPAAADIVSSLRDAPFADAEASILDPSPFDPAVAGPGSSLALTADEKVFVTSLPAEAAAESDSLLTAFVTSLRVAQPTMGRITVVEPDGGAGGLIYDLGRDGRTVRLQTLNGRHVRHVTFGELSEGELTGLTTIRATFLGTPEPQPQSIPEPETWAMMLLGFGVLGAALRRARRILGGQVGADSGCGSAP